MKINKGFIVPLLLGVIALLVIGGGIYIYQNKKAEAPAVVDTTKEQLPKVPSELKTDNTSTNNSNWSTYTNTQGGFEVQYPADIFALNTTKQTLIHKLKSFHVYSEKDGSDLGLGSDIFFIFNKEDSTNKGCDYLEKTINIKSLGVPFKLGSIQGIKYEMGAEGMGIVDYCIKNADTSNRFLITRGFLSEAYSTDLKIQSDFIPTQEQEKISDQILSTFKFTSSGVVSYKNTEYGFALSLPADWSGYTIKKETWDAGKMDSSGTYTPNEEKGPEIIISHPLVSKNNETIPIWVLTPAQWARKDVNYNGAAPVDPTVLGQNSQHVFLLPPRYNFGYNPGNNEEIFNIDNMIRSSFKTF